MMNKPASTPDSDLLASCKRAMNFCADERARRKSVYQQIISEINPDVNPRWVEGFMRLQYSTLSHLDHRTFRTEVALFASMMPDMGQDDMDLWESNAQSYGL